MRKYEPLGQYLKRKGTEFIPMTFDEVEKVIGSPLPPSKNYPAWWSNNASNNVMTKVWLDAGYRTEQIDIENGRLVFHRVRQALCDGEKTAPSGGQGAGGGPTASTKGGHPLLGSMKGLITVAPDADLTQPADPDWADGVAGKAAQAGDRA